MSKLSENTGQSGPDFTHYKEMLEEGKAANRQIGGQLIPRLYEELNQKQGLSSDEAGTLILRDCVPTWSYGYVMKLLSDAGCNIKDLSRQIGGKASAKEREVRKAKSLTEKEKKVLLDHVSIAEIIQAQMASTDGKVWAILNSKDVYQKAEPVTPKPVTTDPLTVKTSSAPIRST